MKRVKKIQYCIILNLYFFSTIICNGQHFQFSQYNFTNQRVNPGMVGVNQQAIANYIFRNQQVGGNTQIVSNSVSLEYPLLRLQKSKHWSAVAITLLQDKAAEIFKTEEASVSYAMHIRVKKFATLSLGVRVLLQTRMVDTNGFFTSSQYVPNRGFNPNISNNENVESFKSTLATYSTGLFWQETDKKGRRIKYAGFSIYDFNRPTNSFLGDNGRLSSTYVFLSGMQVASINDFNIFGETLFTYTIANPTWNTGFRIQKEINIHPLYQSDRIELITLYTKSRTAIVGVQVHTETFAFGLSYDFPLQNVNVGNRGAFEIGIEWHKSVKSKDQRQQIKNTKKRREYTIAKQSSMRENKNETIVKRDTIPQDEKEKLWIMNAQSRDSLIEVERNVITNAQAGVLKQEINVVEKVVLHFSFDFNSSKLDDKTKKYLKELAITLGKNKMLRLRIEGHTDNIGTDEYNFRLSQKRADEVKNYLVQRGIELSRISSEGMGKLKPIADNDTENTRAQNRRVELIVYTDSD
jgi:type IX secretion system PorP/SprF family membrane protein